jgi:beta-lactamase superfamily II metal-dependent hydrolase
MDRLPIMNRHIDEIDLLLLTHPLLDNSTGVEIIKRDIRVLWIEYEEADAERKRQILHSLKKHHRALPRHYQEELWQLWWRWLDVFEEEEVANGTRTSRRYVWSPSARLGGCNA